MTTNLLGIGDRQGRIVFSTREETTLCCTEEAARVFQKCGATVVSCMPSGTKLSAGIEFLAAEGSAQALHAGWKVALNLLEYSSDIASRTQRIVEKAELQTHPYRLLPPESHFPEQKK